MPISLIVIAGPTGVGKSDMAVSLAQSIEGSVIVGCDATQMYQGFDLSSAKVPGVWRQGVFLYKNITHYLIDQLSLDAKYTVLDYVQDVQKLVQKLAQNGVSTIILCGGTHYYMKAVLEGWVESGIEPSYTKQPNFIDRGDYFSRALTMQKPLLNRSDLYNPRRVERWLTSAPKSPIGLSKNLILSQILWLDGEDTWLQARLKKRIQDRIQQGLEKECQDIISNNPISIQKSLECRWWDLVSKGMVAIDAEKDLLYYLSWQYVRKQRTWKTKLSELAKTHGITLEMVAMSGIEPPT